MQPAVGGGSKAGWRSSLVPDESVYWLARWDGGMAPVARKPLGHLEAWSLERRAREAGETAADVRWCGDRKKKINSSSIIWTVGWLYQWTSLTT